MFIDPYKLHADWKSCPPQRARMRISKHRIRASAELSGHNDQEIFICRGFASFAFGRINVRTPSSIFALIFS